MRQQNDRLCTIERALHAHPPKARPTRPHPQTELNLHTHSMRYTYLPPVVQLKFLVGVSSSTASLAESASCGRSSGCSTATTTTATRHCSRALPRVNLEWQARCVCSNFESRDAQCQPLVQPAANTLPTPPLLHRTRSPRGVSNVQPGQPAKLFIRILTSCRPAVPLPQRSS